MNYLVDTNVLLTNPEIITKYNCVITSHVIRELEKHKTSLNHELAYKARVATRTIEENINNVKFDVADYRMDLGREWDGQYVDNVLICACRTKKYGIITNDLLLKQKAIMFGIEVINSAINEVDYKGYEEVQLTSEEIAELYENGNRRNMYNLLNNQYLIVRNQFYEVVEIVKWSDKEGFVKIKSDGKRGRNNYYKSTFFGEFKPKDEYQTCAIDSLNHNKMTMIKGKAGSGKSYVALSYAMAQIEKGNYDKIIIAVNPVPVLNSQKLGFYPGDRNSKILESIGAMLSTKFGSMQEIENMVQNGKIILIPVCDIRGADFGSMNAIVYISEAQNMDVELMKLVIQRVGDDNKLIIDGDYNQQVDLHAFANSRNGMRKVSEVFRGQDFYGEVELSKIHRSLIAEVAQGMS